MAGPGLITHWPPGRILLAARGLTAVLAQGRPGGVVVGISASPQLVKASRCGSGLEVASCRSGPLEDPPPWHHRRSLHGHYGHLDPLRDEISGRTRGSREEVRWVALLVGGRVCPVNSAQC